MALQIREFTGTTGSPYWTWKIKVTEENYIENNVVSTNKVRIIIESYLGRTTVAGNSFFDGRATLNFSAGSQQSDSISFVGGSSVNAGAWHYMDSYSFIVDNTGTINDPTQIQVSGSMSGAGFSPYNASASGNLSLTPLHTPPEINNINIKEINSGMVSLGVTDDTIVQYLSQKKFTIDALFFDETNAKEYSIYHNNILIGTSSTNELTVDFSNVSELVDSGTGYVAINVSVIDDLGGNTTRNFTFPVIKYTRPTIEKTSTTIKRKTGSGTVLTDNKALLNFIGTCYKGNDVIGNNNTPLVQYKIWNTTEPNYMTLTTPNIANVTISNYEISNVLYTSTYDYKIMITDTFTTTETTINLKVDKVPTGVSVWTEYKDRVDFLKLTIQNNDPFSYSTEEQVIGTWIDGNPLYRKVISVNTDYYKKLEFSHGIEDYKKIWIDFGDSYYLADNGASVPLNANSYYGDFAQMNDAMIYQDNVILYSTGGWGTAWTKVITIKYTKTTD